MSDTSSGNGKVVVNRAMSLDGFIAARGDAMNWIFEFMALESAAAMISSVTPGPRESAVSTRLTPRSTARLTTTIGFLPSGGSSHPSCPQSGTAPAEA